MKQLKNLMLCSVAFLAMTVTGCGGNNGKKAPLKPVVFVLTGQSNMEGQSSWNNNYLKNAMQALQESEDYSFVSADDYETIAPAADNDPLSEVPGIENVRTSYYGCGYGEIYNGDNEIHASYDGDGPKITGKFLNTRVGMGYRDSAIGPELGAAYRLSSVLEEGQMVYFIKCGVSGSGFEQDGSRYGGDRINWNVEKEANLYVNILKPYTQNCLDLIEEEAGVKPVVKGFLWMQGESDSDAAKIPLYANRMNNLLDAFKTDFAGYAVDEDKENISFIDACIYDNEGTQWGYENSHDLNQVKMDNAAAHDNYYCINTSWQLEGGMKLTTGSPGGNGGAHYSTESMLKLGIAFADVMIDNDLLDY